MSTPDMTLRTRRARRLSHAVRSALAAVRAAIKSESRPRGQFPASSEPLERRLFLSATPSISGTPSVTQGTAYTLHLQANSTATVNSWQINWDDGNVESVIGNPSTRTHTYTSSGNFVISATVTDTDGTYSAGNLALDSSFNGMGFNRYDFGYSTDYGYDLAIQPDASGTVQNLLEVGTSDGFLSLARVEPDGTLDTSFNSSGIEKTPVAFSNPGGTARVGVGIQSDRKILIASTVGSYPNDDYVLLRLNPDGAMDTTFNGTGQVVTDVNGSSDDIAMAVAQQGDSVLVAGESSAEGSIVRYTSTGQLDTTFNGTGKLVIPTARRFVKLIPLPNGQVLAGGYEQDWGGSTGSNFCVFRINSDGTVDNTFGVNGRAEADFGQLDYADSMALAPDGTIVVAGRVLSPDGSKFIMGVARFNPGGTPDTSLNGTGKMTADYGDPWDYVFDVAVQSDSKMVVADESNGQEHAYRFLSDGTPDSTFGNGGVVTPSLEGSTSDQFGGYYTQGGMVIQSDGKIVLGGAAQDSSTGMNFFLTRYLPSNSVAVYGTPTAALNAQSEVTEGDTVVLGGSFSDPDGDMPDHWTVNWDDGQPSTDYPGYTADVIAEGDQIGGPANATHVYDEPGTHTVTATAVDADGSWTATPITIQVDEATPTFTVDGADTFVEGQPYTLTPTFSDPGGDLPTGYSVDSQRGHRRRDLLRRPRPSQRDGGCSDADADG